MNRDKIKRKLLRDFTRSAELKNDYYFYIQRQCERGEKPLSFDDWKQSLKTSSNEGREGK